MSGIGPSLGCAALSDSSVLSTSNVNGPMEIGSPMRNSVVRLAQPPRIRAQQQPSASRANDSVQAVVKAPRLVLVPTGGTRIGFVGYRERPLVAGISIPELHVQIGQGFILPALEQLTPPGAADLAPKLVVKNQRLCARYLV